MAQNKLARMLRDQFSVLKNKRANWESHWQEIADFVLPRRADVNVTRSRGDKRTERIFDATALRSSELFASSLHGMLTNPATAWFSMRYKDESIAKDKQNKDWLEACTETMYMALDRSNFQQEVHELYSDLITFGTGCMMIESDEESFLRFSTRHIKEVYIQENNKAQVDTIHREIKMTARAVVQQFGIENVGKNISQAMKKSPHEDVTIYHCVKPNDKSNPYEMKNSAMKFSSMYYTDDGHLISASGYKEFPFVVPRYLKSSSEVYGRSPAMTSLPDIKMINKMSETTIKAAQKMVDPPLLVPDDSFMLPIRTNPGGLNFYRSGTRDTITPLAIGANTPLGLQIEEQRRTAIKQAFYVDQLLMSQNQMMTATEVMQRNEEKMRLLAPVLGRLQSEMLRPLIDRTFAILLRKQILPAPPESLQGQDINIEYVSPLARSQKLGDIQAILRTLEITTPLAQMSPLMDYMNNDELIVHLAKVLGVPSKVMRSTTEVEEIRQQRAQQQQEAQQQQQQMQLAETAAKSPQLMEQMQQGG